MLSLDLGAPPSGRYCAGPSEQSIADTLRPNNQLPIPIDCRRSPRAGAMPNADRSRAPRPGQRQRGRDKVRTRASTPEGLLESHLHQLFEKQQLLHNLLITHCPSIGLGRADLIPEDFEGESLYGEETNAEENPSPKPGMMEENAQRSEAEPETDLEQDPDKDIDDFKAGASKVTFALRSALFRTFGPPLQKLLLLFRICRCYPRLPPIFTHFWQCFDEKSKQI